MIILEDREKHLIKCYGVSKVLSGHAHLTSIYLQRFIAHFLF